jgi:hypothetical protein
MSFHLRLTFLHHLFACLLTYSANLACLEKHIGQYINVRGRLFLPNADYAKLDRIRKFGVHVHEFFFFDRIRKIGVHVHE